MNTAISIVLKLTNGETRTFAKDEAITFEWMQTGMLFVHCKINKNVEKIGGVTKKIHYRYERFWFPVSQIKECQVVTNSEITDQEEIRKYDAFKKHNIDIMLQKISHTGPPGPEQVQAIIDEMNGKKPEEKKPVVKPPEKQEKP